MKEVELFYLHGCPYCVKARKAIGELLEEYPAFEEITIKWIEESEEPALTTGRDYYYVPSLFFQGEKLYEAQPGQSYEDVRDHIRAALEHALQA